MSFELLSEPIKKFIRKKGWDQLRPIQNGAIARILATNSNYILISRTASGKTEAAFLPILTKVNFNNPGVKVLYISPLIALINDQFLRIEDLCKDLEIPVTKWHGEAKRSLKNKLLKNPSGIVLITPESIEAMLVNKPYNANQLFSNLEFIVIDEIHSFIGTDRGTQLKSLISRLQNLNLTRISTIGLSATMSEENKFLEVKDFTGSIENTKILIDRASNKIDAKFRYFENKKPELPLDLIKDLYLQTKDNKTLIFPNSRARTEEIAVKLKKISRRVNGHSNYFSHHSSVNKEIREYVEFFAKNNVSQNFCISCTSTLELGIDIGSIDQVVQIDATHSIASLIQRVGRSGRIEGTSNLHLYATTKWSLLQSLACWLLYKDGFIEPPFINSRPFDILLHQALSITKQNSGIESNELIRILKNNTAFSKIDVSEIKEIIDHLVSLDLLEKLQGEVIVGVEGEYIVNSRDFYSVFQIEENFKILSSGNVIGELPFSPQLLEDQNVLLSARVWKIVFVDHKSKKVEVVPAKDGKPPIFFGSSALVHKRVRLKMLDILYTTEHYNFLDENSNDQINFLRKDFSIFRITNIQFQRPLLENDKELKLFTFSSSRINRTIELLFNYLEIGNNLNEGDSSFTINSSKNDLVLKWPSMSKQLSHIDQYISNTLKEKPSILGFSKWGGSLPEKFKINLLRDSYYDIEGTKDLLTKIELKSNK